MAIVRWSDKSDVYIYYGIDGYVCHVAQHEAYERDYYDRNGPNPKILIDHLNQLRKDGYKVPEYVFQELENDVKYFENQKKSVDS